MSSSMNGMCGTERAQLIERPDVKPFQGLAEGILEPRVALRLPWASEYNALGVEDVITSEVGRMKPNYRISTSSKGPLTRPLRLNRHS